MSEHQQTATQRAVATLRRWFGVRDAVTSVDSSEIIRWGGMSWDEWVRSTSGLVMSETAARGVSTVVACTNLLAGSIASLPLHIYRRTPDGRERATSGIGEAIWWLFNERPHPEWPAAAWWQFMSDSRLFHGDAFALIRRGGAYGVDPVSFEPWHPLAVTPFRFDGRIKYRLSPKWPGDHSLVVEPDDMLHIPGPGFDGLRSMSQLKHGLLYPAGIASAADQQAGQVMADGARPDMAIEIPGTMGEAQREDFRKRWMDRHSGQGSKRAPVILAGGAKLHQLTMTMEDAQLLATRSMQVEEICRVFGVPPHMVGHVEKTTSWGSGVEQMSIGFVKYTLQRHLVAFEQEINHKLFKTSKHFSEFLTAGLERGDTKTRFEAYRVALGRAGEQSWIHPSEIRSLENLPRDPELDKPPNPAVAPQPTQGNP